MNALITVDTVCERYGIERHAAGRLLKKIPHFVVGNRLCAHEQDLHDWEMSQMQYPVQRTKKSAAITKIPRRK